MGLVENPDHRWVYKLYWYTLLSSAFNLCSVSTIQHNKNTMINYGPGISEEAISLASINMTNSFVVDSSDAIRLI